MTARQKLLRDAGLLPLACAIALSAAPAAGAAKKPDPHNFRAHPMPHNFIKAPSAT